MKHFSNTYIFTFSAIMVVIVAAILSIIALQLQPIQDRNEQLEKMKNILASVHIESTAKNAEDLFQKYIVDSYVVNIQGDKVESLDAFTIDLKKELDKINKIQLLKEKTSEKQESPFQKFISSLGTQTKIDNTKTRQEIQNLQKLRYLPVFECQKDGLKYYIFPLRGKGLWGPIWGYISLHQDMKTIYGAMFDHKTETPGLGAEIADLPFQSQFSEKKIYNEENEFVSIEVVKGGADPANIYAVDAISGGTITSKALEEMCYDFLIDYSVFLKSKMN
jgi:Na+-transporting NADH:ubiquinone oxidoreductase subunit C